MFTIVVQLFDLVKPADFAIPSWRAVAKGRATVCSAHLKCNEALGKQILMEVANGASPDKFQKLTKQGMTFLKAKYKPTLALVSMFADASGIRSTTTSFQE